MLIHSIYVFFLIVGRTLIYSGVHATMTIFFFSLSGQSENEGINMAASSMDLENWQKIDCLTYIIEYYMYTIKITCA